MADLVSRLLEAIGEAERLAEYRDVSNEHVPTRCADESWHTMNCGYYQGEHAEPCGCPVPAAIVRRCAADRDLVVMCEAALTAGGQAASEKERHQGIGSETMATITLTYLAKGYGLETES